MHPRHRASFAGKVGQIVFAGILVSGLSAQVSEIRPRVGIPEDWTHHHIRFSAAAIRQHPEIASREPRAALHLYREALLAAMSSNASASVTPMHRDWSINLGAGRVQFGQYPAKWNSSVDAPPSCTADYVIYGINAVGVTGGQAQLVGLTNLYTAGASPLCSGGQPLFLFSFNTSTIAGGKIVTSPVLSLNGKKVAFIETNAAAGAKATVLHVLTLPTTIGANGTNAVASVAPPAGTMVNVTIVANNSSIHSSPWVDYPSDTLYVGADNGDLYKVTGVFNGTPTLAGAPWPKLISGGSTLTSPVLDSATGNVFIGSLNGRMYSVNVNTLGAVTNILVGGTAVLNPGVVDSPTIDATGATVFAVTSNDATGAAVVQASISPLAQVARVHIGEGSSAGTAVNVYDGDFDNAYFTSPSTGHLYMCGTGTADTTPWLYSVTFDGSGHLLAATQVNHISTNVNARCGPITEFFNKNIGASGTDFFFWGVTRNCGAGANGCVMSTSNGGTSTTFATEVGGTSGIIVDNNSTAGGASNIHFTTQQNSGNAIEVTQSGLN